MLPSPFCRRARRSWPPIATPTPPSPFTRRGCWRPPPLVGRLRAVVCAPAGRRVDDARAGLCGNTIGPAGRRRACPGADPDAVVRHDPPSAPTNRCGRGDDHVVTLSPSTLQTLADCPLRWLLERHGGTRRPRRAVGDRLVGARPGRRSGQDRGQMLAELERVWEQLPFESRVVLPTTSWSGTGRCCRPSRSGARRPARAHRGGHRGRRRRRARLPTATAGCGCAAGVDRLERDAEGRLVVVDVKTGKSPVSKDDAQRHASWRCTSWPSPRGCCRTGISPAAAGWSTSARPAPAGATEREQDAADAGGRATSGASSVAQAAAATARARSSPRAINDGCAHCPVRPSCPAQAAADGTVTVVTPTLQPRRIGLAPSGFSRRPTSRPPSSPHRRARWWSSPGAGAGKTETMAARVVWLVANGYADARRRCSG